MQLKQELQQVRLQLAQQVVELRVQQQQQELERLQLAQLHHQQ
jgi:hypothetical protein